MTETIRGTRPRPRVAVLGDERARNLHLYSRLFPTVYCAETYDELRKQVDPKEIDLVVVAGDFQEPGSRTWLHSHHVICFSSGIDSLPGPAPHTEARVATYARTEEFILSDLALPLSRLVEADLVRCGSLRGCAELQLSLTADMPKTEFEVVQSTFRKAALIVDRHSEMPFAVVYQRREDSLGVAWLPYPVVDEVAWVETITLEWARSDLEAFPGYADWTGRAEWMLPEEQRLVEEIDFLEERKREMVAQLTEQIGQVTARLAALSHEVNHGRRHLLTAQGDDLVEEVARVFREWGFEVEVMDSLIPEGQPRREDLRLRDACTPGWEAIVEVRGYGRSGGKVDDLMRLGRFGSLYQAEKGHSPDQQIYIVNGELELPVYARQPPLASDPDTVQAFGESDGVIAWTVDIFRAAKATPRERIPELRDSLKRARGRWAPPEKRST